MTRMRRAAVAGTWYPGHPKALAADLDDYLRHARVNLRGRVQAVIAPHAGLMFSGPTGAYSYKAAAAGSYDVVLLVGPSHHVAFDGVSVWPSGAFESPLGPAAIDEACAARILQSPIARDLPEAHAREHSLEMQVPFLRHLLPDVPVVPIVMGHQQRDVIEALGELLADVARERRALLVASTDLSHFFDAARAAALDGRVQAHVAAFDVDGFFATFEEYPEYERGRYVACGGGAALSVMLAARRLGAQEGRVLKYSHSGEISGDNEGVVGYLAAAFGTFDAAASQEQGC